MNKYFKGFDLTTFWEESDYAKKEYVEDAPSDETIKEIENDLGYKLPGSYIELMQSQNGGIPLNSCFPTTERTSWAEDHVAISGIFGIGKKKIYSLCGGFGSRFMMEEWEYPDIGIYFGDCPSAGHDMICLDYRSCGREGEPKVVHVDQESDYKITFLADTFEEFVLGLVSESKFDEGEEW